MFSHRMYIFSVIFLSPSLCSSDTLLLENKFTRGHFQGEVQVSKDVPSSVQCAMNCLRRRPQCQSFNLKQLENNGWYSCEVLQTVPPSLTTDNFAQEEDALYFELSISNEGPQNVTCDEDNETCRQGATCETSIERTCYTNNSKTACSIEQHSHCLKKYGQNSKTWDEARETCNSEGGRLPEPRTMEEQAILMNLMNEIWQEYGYDDSVVMWLGGYGSEMKTFSGRSWMWQDGSPIENPFWARSDPNNKEQRVCIALTVNNNWFDKACDISAPFVCEYWLKARC